MTNMNELEKSAHSLREKVQNLEKQIEEAVNSAIGIIAVRVLATLGITLMDEEKKWTTIEERPGYMSERWSDEYNAWRVSTVGIIAKVSDVLIRLVLAEKCGLTHRGDSGHYCCPDDNPKYYTDAMAKLNLGELVENSRRGQCYQIPAKKFDEAHTKLMEVHSVTGEISGITELRSELASVENELGQVCTILNGLREEDRYNKALAGQIVSDRAKSFITDLLKNGGSNSIAVANPDVFVWLTDRSEHGNSGGCGYFDQVHAYYFGQTKMEEYQWRDRYSADRDKPWLKVNSLENATVTLEGTKATVKVTLVNNDSKRPEQFTFEHKEVPAVVELTAEEQATFNQKVAEAIKTVMSRLEELWHLKPMMIGTHGYVPYRRPLVKQNVTRANLGVAAFVTEEQIDHRGSDPQTRYELFVMTHKDATPKMVIEDHGYERREGSNVIAIVELNQDSVLVNTVNGKKTFKL